MTKLQYLLFSGQLRIKQLVYQNAKDSNQVFYCYLIFLVNFVIEFSTLAKRCVVGPRSWSIVSYTMFIIFDIMTIYYLVMTTITINDAIVEYQLGKLVSVVLLITSFEKIHGAGRHSKTCIKTNTTWST